MGKRYNPSHGFHLAFFASVLAFCVIVLGAYTRLTDAGLGCPDWPNCYGQWIPIENGTINMAKAWTEMIHRYLAAFLGLVIFALVTLALYNRQHSEQPVILPVVLGFLIIFQALLGMWTVTLKLFPLVVMAHLLGGMTTLSLLWWLTLRLKPRKNLSLQKTEKIQTLQLWALTGLGVLIIQLFLGGWTSANYAALVCTGFPHCDEKFIHLFDFSQAFNLFSAGVDGSQGQPLNNAARITIHMTHRFGALLTAIVIGWLALLCFLRTHSLLIKTLSILLAALLIIQVLLGITNILALLPLPVAVAHNAVSALLLLTLITVNYYLYSMPRKKNER